MNDVLPPPRTVTQHPEINVSVHATTGANLASLSSVSIDERAVKALIAAAQDLNERWMTLGDGRPPILKVVVQSQWPGENWKLVGEWQ